MFYQLNNKLSAAQETYVDDFNALLLKAKSETSYVDPSKYNKSELEYHINQLLSLDNGGFDHGDMSGLYVKFQNNNRYKTTRYLGWQNLFNVIRKYTFNQQDERSLFITDFLAGSGTLSQRVKVIWEKSSPIVMGIDVSQKMCMAALKQGETVFWGNCDFNYFRPGCADASVAAYGLHHVPKDTRSRFVKGMTETLKKDGVCLLHDFVEGSPTAKFYAEIINNYRLYGHPYEHFREDEMRALLSPYFENVHCHLIYDPFYLVGRAFQNPSALKKEFFAYLMGLFNLNKLLPKGECFESIFYFQDSIYWDRIEELFAPYFNISFHLKELQHDERVLFQKKEKMIQKVSVPIVNQLTIQMTAPDQWCLIAPRVALVGVGVKKKEE